MEVMSRSLWGVVAAGMTPGPRATLVTCAYSGRRGHSTISLGPPQVAATTLSAAA